MGFIKGMLGKSLFTEESYRGALGKSSIDGTIEESNLGYSCILIKPNRMRLGWDRLDPSVVGIIKDNIKLDYEASWDSMGGITSIIPGIPLEIQKMGETITKLGMFAGAAQFGQVYGSKLVYYKSGYLELSPTFRVVDWKGTGEPLKAAYVMASYCVPILSDKNIMEKFAEFVEYLKSLDKSERGIVRDSITLAQKSFTLLQKSAIFAKESVESFLERYNDGVNIVQGLSNAFKQVTEEVMEDYASIRSSPTPVSVYVGQYFKHEDMVIKRVSVEFSKQMTEIGPLYADITVDLSSRKIMGDPKDLGMSIKHLGFNRFVKLDQVGNR